MILKKIFHAIKQIVIAYKEIIIHHFLKKLARHGDEEALYHIGCIYEKGNFVKERNLIAAYQYFYISAIKGYAPSQEKIATLEVMLAEEILRRARESVGNDPNHNA